MNETAPGLSARFAPPLPPLPHVRDWLSGRRAALIVPLLLLAFTLIARAGSLGDPDYHVDETFYLLVGDAMRHGAVPYVDIWDRKPPGLFVFFWLLAGISRSVLVFQIAAILFTTATATLIAWIARRWASPHGALFAGLVYVAWLQPLLGGGGQAPVFYNLFVVAAVALLVRDVARGRPTVSLPDAVAAALLCGIAVSFKPTAVVEGTFVVLAFTLCQWQRTRAVPATVRLFVAMGTAAALPTLAGFAWFWAQGQFGAFWQATVVSNFLKARANPELFGRTVRFLLLLSLPLTSVALLGHLRGRRESPDRAFAALMLCWVGAAIGGFLAVPNFYSHYALALVPVLAVSAAPMLAHGRLGRIITLLICFWALYYGQSFDLTKGVASQERFGRAVRVIRDNMPNGTLHVFDGPPWLYTASGGRWQTRFVFPEHLSMGTEARAIGVDPVAETARVLATRPDVIVLTSTPKPDANRATTRLVRDRLARDYTLVCRMPGLDFEHHFLFEIYARGTAPDRRGCPLASDGMRNAI